MIFWSTFFRRLRRLALRCVVGVAIQTIAVIDCPVLSAVTVCRECLASFSDESEKDRCVSEADCVESAFEVSLEKSLIPDMCPVGTIA